MKRFIIAILLFPVTVYAFDANDLRSFAADWLKSDPNIATPANDHNGDHIVNFLDFAYFAISWTGTLGSSGESEPNIPPPSANIKPTAYAVDVNVVAYESKLITLSAADDNLPQPHNIRYVITSLPTDGNLYDDILTYKTNYVKFGSLSNMARASRRIISVPYTLSRFKNTLLYLCDTNSPTTRTFSYKANDGLLDSDSATVTLHRTAYPKNTITFKGGGYIDFQRPTAIDFNSPYAMCFWVRTKQQFAGLFSITGTTSGMDILIESGNLVCKMYDSNGVRFLRSYGRIDTGVWQFCGITRDANSTMLCYVASPISEGGGEYNDRHYTSLPTLGIVGGHVHNKIGFKGDLDDLRFYSYGFSSFNFAQIYIDFGPPTDYVAKWDFNEGTGSTVTDSIGGKTGSFSDVNEVLWHPLENPLFEIRPQFIGGF